VYVASISLSPSLSLSLSLFSVFFLLPKALISRAFGILPADAKRDIFLCTLCLQTSDVVDISLITAFFFDKQLTIIAPGNTVP